MWNQWMGIANPATAHAGTIGAVPPAVVAPGMEAAAAAYPQYAQYTSMTPEQQIALQQHWQQWQTYQQEYAKWHAQYGEQYNREMAAAANASAANASNIMPMVPPVPPTAAPPTPAQPPVPTTPFANGPAQFPITASLYQKPPPPPPPEETHPDNKSSKSIKNTQKITGEPQLYNTTRVTAPATYAHEGPPPMHMNQPITSSSIINPMNLNQTQQWAQNPMNQQQSSMNFNHPPPNQSQWQQTPQNAQVNLMQPPPNFNQFGNPQLHQSALQFRPPPVGTGSSNERNLQKNDKVDQTNRNDFQNRQNNEPNKNESAVSNSLNNPTSNSMRDDGNANMNRDYKNQSGPFSGGNNDAGNNNSVDNSRYENRGNFRGNAWNNNNQNNPIGPERFNAGNNRGNNFEPNNNSNRNFNQRQDNINPWNNSNRNQGGGGGSNNAHDNRNNNNNNNRGDNFNQTQGPSNRNMGNFGSPMNSNLDNRWPQNQNHNQNQNYNNFQNGGRNFESNDNFNQNRWAGGKNRNDGNPPFNRSKMGFNNNNNMNKNNSNINNNMNANSNPNMNNNRGQQRVPELDEEEFIKQFKKWEEQYNIWKKDNANHPDKEMYCRYEQEFEKQRQRIVERLESIRRRKMEQMTGKINQNLSAVGPNSKILPSSPDKRPGNYQSNNDNFVAPFGQNMPRGFEIGHLQGNSENAPVLDNAQPLPNQETKTLPEKVVVSENDIPEREKSETINDVTNPKAQQHQEPANEKGSPVKLQVAPGQKRKIDVSNLDDKPRILSVQNIITLDDEDDQSVSAENTKPEAGPMKEIFKKSEGIPGLDLVEETEKEKPKDNSTEIIDLDADVEDGPTLPPKVAATTKNQVTKIPSLFDIVVEKPNLDSHLDKQNLNASNPNDTTLPQSNPTIPDAIANVADALKDKNLLQNIIQVLASAQSMNGVSVANPCDNSLPREQGGRSQSPAMQQMEPTLSFAEWQRNRGNNRGGNDNPDAGNNMNIGYNSNETMTGRFNNANNYPPSQQGPNNFNYQNSGNFGPNTNGGNRNNRNNDQQFMGNQNSMMQGGSGGSFFNRNQGGPNFGGGFSGAPPSDSMQFNANNNDTMRRNIDNPFRRNCGGPIPVFDDNDKANQRSMQRGPNNPYHGKLAWTKGPAFNNESDEFYRRAQVFDYTNSSIAPKVIDYGHKPTAVVAINENSNSSSLTDEFRPIKTIDYGHAGNSTKSFMGPGPFNRQQRRKNKKNKNKMKGKFINPIQQEKSKDIENENEPLNKSEQNKQAKPITEPKETAGQSNILDNECFEEISDTEDDIPDDPEPVAPPPPPILSQERTEKDESSSSTMNANAQNDPNNVPSIHRLQMSFPSMENNNTISIDEILLKPERFSRPKKLCIILRGPPASGKSYVAKLIKEKEVEMGGTNPRILSIDDYFLIENDYEEVCSKTGKKIPKKELLYEYDEDMEETYMTSLIKSFKKTIADNLYEFIIIDCINNSLRTLNEFYCHAKDSGFVPYIMDLLCDLQTCMSRNVHNRREADIKEIIDDWKSTPDHYIKLDVSSLLENVVEMEDVIDMVKDETDISSIDASSSQQLDDSQEDDSNEAVESCGFLKSKWENDTTSQNLARLDGTNKPINKRKAATMEDYLQVDDWEPPKVTADGKKRVRWADIEEKRAQEKMRAIGFVVGQTDWKRMMDNDAGNRALNQTRYIERANTRR